MISAWSVALGARPTELVLTQNQELVAQGHGQGDNANLMRLYGQIK